MKHSLNSAIAILVIAVQSPFAIAADSLELTLPPVCYAVAGQPMEIVFDNLVLSKDSTAYRFQVEVEVKEGAAVERSAERWKWTPTESDVGRRPLAISVFDGDGAPVANAKGELFVAPADAGRGRPWKCLIVGDSLTHATLYPNELARLMSQPGNPNWSMIGTHRPASAAEGVRHEGYGGWTWERFNTLFTAAPDPTNVRKQSSPFVFAGEGETPALDVARYLRENSAEGPPDTVFFLLGINDCFGANPDDPKAMDSHIDRTLAQADRLLQAFHKAAPDCELIVGLTPPPNSRDAAFEANYKGRYPRWGWKRIQHRLVQRQISHFGGREKEKVFLAPTGLNLDPAGGYPVDNGVHPNAAGYRQIAASLYAFAKNRLAERDRRTPR